MKSSFEVLVDNFEKPELKVDRVKACTCDVVFPHSGAKIFFGAACFAPANNAVDILSNMYGNDGYAVWYRLLEYQFPLVATSFDVNGNKCRPTSPFDHVLISMLHVSPRKARAILNACAEIGLIDKDEWAIGLISVPLVNKYVEEWWSKEHNSGGEKPKGGSAE